MRIVEIIALDNGAHRNQSWNIPIPPEGYAVIPDDMVTSNFPFGEITVEEVNGVMTVASWIPGDMPESEPEPEEESAEPITDADLAAAILDGVNNI